MNEFHGNLVAKELLAGVLKRKAPGHAYLIYGADGLGKTTFAMHFAMSLLCQNEHKPCGECPACTKLLHGTHPDFAMLEPVGKSSSITVDMIRALRAEVAIKPNESDYKIYVISKVHRMTEGAFNAFLKTLEEPPPHVVFLLTVPTLSLLAPTILSRVVPVGLFALSDETVADVLAKEFGSIEESVRRQAVLLAEGNLGKAKACLLDETFADRQQQVQQFCTAIARKQDYTLLQVLSKFERDKPGVQLLLEDVLLWLRSMMLYRVDATRPLAEWAQPLIYRLTIQELLLLIQCLETVKKRFDGNGNYQLLLYAVAAEIGQCLY